MQCYKKNMLFYNLFFLLLFQVVAHFIYYYYYCKKLSMRLDHTVQYREYTLDVPLYQEDQAKIMMLFSKCCCSRDYP